MSDNPEHAKFGNGIGVFSTGGYSRWFNGSPRIEKRPMVTMMEHWICPIEDCGGEMKYNGSAWPMSPMGYHHTCDKCGFTAALSGVKFPKLAYENRIQRR